MGIYAITLDQSGCRLLTCEADKTQKIYKEDDEAVIFLKYCISFYINYKNYNLIYINLFNI